MKLLCLPAFFIICIFIFSKPAHSQTIGNFASITPTTQTQNLVLPSTHTFQRILRSGTTLTSGETAGSTFDFAGYVPIGGSSTNGYLSISSETVPAECAILNIDFNNTNKLWNISSSGKVPFPLADIGPTAAFCAGTVTPKNTVMVCEEATPTLDFNGDGYQDVGWIIEIDPATRKVINQDNAGGVDKLWAMGRQKHEDVAIKADQSVAYWSADDATTGYVYKFVPTVPGNFSAGTLYVLQTTGALGTGTWQLVNNTTQDERNNTISLSTAAGGYNFNRIEGLEIGPDGKIYFAATTSGRVYRFADAGATVSNLGVFVESTNYDVDGAGPLAPIPWGVGADNLAFDGEGNLWVLQDGDNNYIWVVGPTHTAATPDVRLFATMPAGSEPTGITFSPDHKFLFLSVQHPSTSNTAAQMDAAGNSVVFDTHTTVVIARKEFLGTANGVLPVRFTHFTLAPASHSIVLNWTAEDVQLSSHFTVQRSSDGIHFQSIGTVPAVANNSQYVFIDHQLPDAATLYYRIEECDAGGCASSEIKNITIKKETQPLTIFPNPALEKIQVNYITSASSTARIKITSSNGLMVYQKVEELHTGNNSFTIPTASLAKGAYILWIEQDGLKYSKNFIKQ